MSDFDHDAWMKRGAERQKLFEKLQSVVARKDSDCPAVAYELSALIMERLTKLGGITTSAVMEPGTEERQAARTLLDEEIMPAIEAFTPDEADIVERYKVLVELHDWAAELITGQLVSAFGWWESMKFRAKK